MRAPNFFLYFFIFFIQASEKKEYKFKFATHMPSKMEQVMLFNVFNNLFMFGLV